MFKLISNFFIIDQIKGRDFWNKLEQQYQPENRQKNIQMVEEKLEKMIEVAEAADAELLSNDPSQELTDIDENQEILDPMEISFAENKTDETNVNLFAVNFV